MPKRVYKAGDIVPGDLFEDCRYHPCLCYEVGDSGSDAVFGISLIDGSTWQCSIVKCRVRKLTPAEAWQWKSEGPPAEDLPPEERWRRELPPVPPTLPSDSMESSPRGDD